MRVVDYSPGGREVIYAVLGPGSHFGELAAIDGRGRSASVLAVEDCVLAAITPADLDSLLRRFPDLALALIRQLVEIIRTSDERITELSTLGAMQRVGRELLRLAEPGPAGAFVDLAAADPEQHREPDRHDARDGRAHARPASPRTG